MVDGTPVVEPVRIPVAPAEPDPVLTPAPVVGTPQVTPAPEEGTPDVTSADSSDTSSFDFWDLFRETRPYLELLAGGGFPKAYDASKNIPISPEMRSATNEQNRMVSLEGGLRGVWVMTDDEIYLMPEARAYWSDGIHSLEEENSVGINAALSAGFFFGDNWEWTLIPRLSVFADYVGREKASPAFPEGNDVGGVIDFTALYRVLDCLWLAAGGTAELSRFNYDESSFSYVDSAEGYGDDIGNVGGVLEAKFTDIPQFLPVIPYSVKLSYRYQYGFDKDLPYLETGRPLKIETDSDRHTSGILLTWRKGLLFSYSLTVENPEDGRLADPLMHSISVFIPAIEIDYTNIGEIELSGRLGDGDNILYRFTDNGVGLNYKTPALFPVGEGIVRAGLNLRGDYIRDDTWYRPDGAAGAATDVFDSYGIDPSKEALEYQNWSAAIFVSIELPPSAEHRRSPTFNTIGASTREEWDRQLSEGRHYLEPEPFVTSAPADVTPR